MDGNEREIGVDFTSRCVYFACNSHNFIKTISISSLIALVTAILFNIYWGVFIIIYFVLGCALAHNLVKNRDRFFNWTRKFRDNICLNKPCIDALHKNCSQCNALNCARHHPDIAKFQVKPWMDLKVPQEVDEALEEILNLLLERHIYPWYSQLSTDDAFVQEIRISLRFIFSSLLKRALTLELVPLLMEKAVSILFQHLEVYLESKKLAKSQREVEAVFLHLLGANLHPAMKSRQSELQYLRQLTENLFPYIVQKKYLPCRSATCLVREIFSNLVFLPVMDIVADPDIVNHLLLLFFDKTPMEKYPDSTVPKVEFLSNFIESHVSNEHSLLHTSLQSILENQSLLYLFMSYLKEECSVNILQFLLSVDDFNSVILNPELSTKDLLSLHQRAQKLYSTFFDIEAADCIKFEESIVNEMKEIISGPPDNVIKLRTTTPLFRAYDHAYTLLEKVYCPMFLQSEKYFHLICGERCSVSVNRNSNRSNKKGVSGVSSISKLGSKLKGVFTANIDDGQLFEEEPGTDLAEALFPDIDIQNEDMYRMDNDPRLKKLSAWRVFIPHVVTGMDQNCKYYHAFHIEVQRIDVRDNDKPEDLHWKLERRYNEFYVLEAKLTEFHGELTVHLPTKRSQYQKGMQFLESRRLEFEKFLQTLLTLPSLQGSELLYKFLRTPIPFTSSFLPDIKLGKMIKTVPRKLIKEKGQNLLPFLQAFLTSTEAAKPKPSKLDWNQLQEMSSAWSLEKLTDCLFGDNFETLKSNGTYSSVNGAASTNTVVYLREIYDYIHYITLEVVLSSSPLLKNWGRILLRSCDILLRYPLQTVTEWYLDYKLREALKPQRLAEVLNLLRDVLFFDDDPPRTRHQKNERASQALEQAKEFFPAILRTQSLDDSLKLLFDALQCPLLNKQLSYILLDNLAVELFPEFLDSRKDEVADLK